MAKVKMSSEEKMELLMRVLKLYNSGHKEEANELAKKVPAEPFMERAWGRAFLEENGFNTSELD